MTGATLSFLSYNGAIRLALVSPVAVIPEPEELVGDVLEGLAELRREMLPP
jgi:hypothetical protein